MESTEIEQKIRALEDDSKLVKGEIKTTVTNIRDFLKELNLSPDNSGEPQKAINADILLVQPPAEGGKTESPPAENKPATPEEEDGSAQERKMKDPFSMRRSGRETVLPEDERLPGHRLSPDSAIAQNENELSGRKTAEAAPENGKSTARINPLVSLIHWVSAAKREIGRQQLPVLLDVYNISGELAPELREIILHLADVIEEKQPVDGSAGVYLGFFRNELSGFLDGYCKSGQLTPEMMDKVLCFIDATVMRTAENKADVWGELLLELQGILIGNAELIIRNDKRRQDENKGTGEAPKEPEKEGDMPLKLKLVLPDGEGGEKEFVLNLARDGERPG